MIGPRAEAVAEAEARIELAERAVQTSQARFDLHTVRAAIDGVLENLSCHPGQTIAAGTPVGEIVDLREIHILAWLSPRTAREVRVGQEVEIAVDLVPHEHTAASEDESSEDEPESVAKVAIIGQVADPQTGNLPIRILVENHDGRFAVGQTARLAITVDENADALAVPAAAVFDLGEGPIVGVVRDGKSVQVHPRLGLTHDGWTVVYDTDLEAGEPVIIDGGYSLPDETPVNVEWAAAGDESHDE